MDEEFIKLIKVDFMYGVEEPWCNNQGVAILPYIIKNNEYYYLLVKENNSLFKGKKISEYGTITGGLENLDPYQTVINEMKEETGIDVTNEKVKIHYLGKHYANKSSTKLWYFFVVDLTNLNLDLYEIYKGAGDGTEAEKDISARFVSSRQLNKSNDALCLTNQAKFFFTLKEKEDLKEKIEDKEIQNFVYTTFNGLKAEEIMDEDISQSDISILEEWSNKLDNKLSLIDKSWIIFDSSSEIAQNLKREAKEYADENTINELANDNLENLNQEVWKSYL